MIIVAEFCDALTMLFGTLMFVSLTIAVPVQHLKIK